MSQNGLLNSSFELGTDWVYGDSNTALPDAWTVYLAGGAPSSHLNKIASKDRTDLGFNHGVLSVFMYDTEPVSSGEFFGLEGQAPLFGYYPAQPNCFSIKFCGYTISGLDIFLRIRWFNASNTLLDTATQLYTAAQLTALGANLTAKTLSVTGGVPAGATYVKCSFGYTKTSAGSTAGYGNAQGVWDEAQYEYSSTPTAYAPADGYVVDLGVSYGYGPKDAPNVYKSGEYLLTGTYPLNNLKLNQHSAATEGFDLIVEKVEGLYEFPTIKASGDHEDNAYHGGFAGVEHVSSRIITMDLALSANSEAIYNRKLAAIKRILLPDGLDKKLYFKRLGIEGLSKKFVNVRVRRFGGFESTYESSRGFARGSLQLLAMDPAIYDAIGIRSTEAPGAGNTALVTFQPWSYATLTPGTFRSYPVVVINGPVTNPHIFRDYYGSVDAEEFYQAYFILATTIPAGQSVTVDFKNRTVIHSSGADWRQYIDDSSVWWAISPHPASNVYIGVFANPNAAGFSATLEWWPAWL